MLISMYIGCLVCGLVAACYGIYICINRKRNLRNRGEPRVILGILPQREMRVEGLERGEEDEHGNTGERGAEETEEEALEAIEGVEMPRVPSPTYAPMLGAVVVPWDSGALEMVEFYRRF
jgi:hypothetical protein